jgi:ligand-binding SRPBCC domain-containing protein
VRPPFFFVDEQRLGPYRFWHHQHHFQEVDSGVEMRDLVHYVMPMGVLGRGVNRLLVRRKLIEIFSFRRRSLEIRFPS